jgi:signal peptidase I
MKKKIAPKKNENFFLSLVWIVLIALIFRAFLFQSYNIPSGSMLKNLLVGDYIFVSKYTYGYSKHSLPFSIPLIPNRIFSSNPVRGDVVVFKLPSDGKTDYIKRVIGMPGDKVQIINGEVYINNQRLSYKEIGIYEDNNLINRKRKTLGCRNEKLKILEETLPNGKSYNILDSDITSYADNTGIYNVPEGHFFVMGDNRDNSQDSRYIKSVGFIPFDNLVGRAELIFFSWNWRKIGQNNCKTSIEWGRIFKLIQ